VTVSEQILDTLPVLPGGQQSDPIHHFVSFRLGQELYALPLAHVECVLRMVAITPVPKAPSWVAGAINLHGRVIPVVDLRQQLGHPAGAFHLSDRLLVVQSRRLTLALVVDQAEEVLSARASEVQPPTEPLSCSRPLSAVIHREEELVLILDAAHLLPAEAGGWRTSPESAAPWGDDLSQIRGIGPAYTARLRAAGIYTFAALAEARADEIAALLGLPSGRMTAVQGWIDQAAARLSGKEA
jgi:purine-binding chemotaxis protein CheW